MRVIFYVLAITVLFAAKVSSQSLSQQVVGVTGNFTAAGGNSLSFTVGEAVIQTLSGSNILTQGFQQPDKLAVTGIVETSSLPSVEIYPNPAQDNLFVKFNTSFSTTTVTVRLTDMTGRNLYEMAANSVSHSFITVPMKNFPAGTYLLTITDGNRNTSLYKIIHLP